VKAAHTTLNSVREPRPAREEFLVFGAPLIEQEEIDEVVDTLRSGWLGTGPKTKAFEAAFAQYIGTPHAIALNSCTAGLHLVLDAWGIGPGDEVITSTLTFAATANVICHVGARPIFVDVDPDTMNMDPDALESAITPRTRAIIPVHFAGRPCQMARIMTIARRYGLKVLEDAAHATEAWYGPQKVGTIGDAAAFSFYSTKNLVTGEGGMVTTADDQLAETVRIRSLHGISKDAWKRYGQEGYQPYECLYPGYKYNMMDLQASIGNHQLAKLERFWLIRDRHWQRYQTAFRDCKALTLPCPDDPIGRHARHLYTILLNPVHTPIKRVEFMEALRQQKIGTGVHFTALHLHPFYRQRFGYRSGQFPVAEAIAETTVSLPLSPKMSTDDVEDVIAAVRRALDTSVGSCHA